MKKGSILTLLLCATLAFALAGCSGEGGSTGAESPGGASQPVEKDMLAGTWTVDKAATFGISGSLALDEDGSAELLVGGDSYVGTWAVSDGSASVTMEGQEAVPAAFSDGKLTIGADGASQLVFVRSEDKPGEPEAEGADEAADGRPGNTEQGDPAKAAEGAANGDADETADSGNVEPELVDEVIADIGPIVIADDDMCTVTVTGRGTDYTADPCYRIAFANKTGFPLYITAEDDFDVNGKTVTAGIDDIADPGETIETELYFPVDELGGGLEQLVNVNGTLNVQIDETYEPVANYPFHMD